MDSPLLCRCCSSSSKPVLDGPDPDLFPYDKFKDLGDYLAGRWEGDGGLDNNKPGTGTVP